MKNSEEIIKAIKEISYDKELVNIHSRTIRSKKRI